MPMIFRDITASDGLSANDSYAGTDRSSKPQNFASKELDLIVMRFVVGAMASLGILMSSLASAWAYPYPTSVPWMPTIATKDFNSPCSKLAARWSIPEQFLWTRTCAGEVVDFNKLLDKHADPKAHSEISSILRRISSEFLETVLFRQPFRDAVTTHGVRVKGAFFDENVDLNNGQLPWQLQLVDSRFEADLNMRELQTQGEVSINGSFVQGRLHVDSAKVGSHLSVSGADLQHAIFEEAEIGRKLDMSGSTIKDKLEIRSTTVGSDMLGVGATVRHAIIEEGNVGRQLDMSGATIRSLEVRSTTVGSDMLGVGATLQHAIIEEGNVGRQLDLSGATIGGLEVRSMIVASNMLGLGAGLQRAIIEETKIGRKLSMDGARVRAMLEIRSTTMGSHLSGRGAIFQDVILREADIGGQLNLTGVTVKDRLRMFSSTVGSHLLGVGASLQQLILEEAKIGGQIDVRNAIKVEHMNIASTKVGTHLWMSGVSLKEFVLRNSKIAGAVDFTKAMVEGDLNMDSVTVGLNLKLMDGEFNTLTLQNTEVSGLVTVPGVEYWPKNLEPEGLTYRQFDGLERDDEDQTLGKVKLDNLIVSLDRAQAFFGPLYPPMAIILCKKEASSSANPFVRWLKLDQTFSYQPYQQLATVLRNAGQSKDADELLYAAKDRERCEKTTGWTRYLGLTALQLTLGHSIGFYIFRAFYWTVPFFPCWDGGCYGQPVSVGDMSGRFTNLLDFGSVLIISCHSFNSTRALRM